MVKLAKAILALLLLLPLCLTPPLASAQTENWTIDGNKVYIDDENVYLSATPHTLGSSGWVEFEFISKVLGNEIDAFWGFDSSSGVEVSKPQIWTVNAPHAAYRWIDVEEQGQLIVNNVTYYEQLDWATFTGEPDIGNRNNTYLYEVTGNFWDEEVPRTLVIACYKRKVVQGTGTFDYNYTTQQREDYTDYYDDWQGLAGAPTNAEFTLEKYDSWQYVRLDPLIETGTTYKLRCWVEIPFSGQDVAEGEYLWGIKQGGTTFIESEASGNLYLLDPWYNASWSYRMKLTFDNTASAENLIDFPVLVHLDAGDIDWTHVQNAGQDIRFTDSDGTTLLDFEIEEWDDTVSADMWVEVPQIDVGVDTDFIWMYYGNAIAADGQDVEGTWNADYIVVLHMDDLLIGSVEDSTVNNNDGTKGSTEIAGFIGKAQDFDGAANWVTLGQTNMPTGNSVISIEFFVKMQELTSRQVFCLWGTEGADTAIMAELTAADKWQFAFWTAGGVNSAVPAVNMIDFFYFVAVYDLADNRLYVDGIERNSVGYNAANLAPGPTIRSQIGAYKPHPAALLLEGIIDEYRISDIDLSADWIEAQNLSMTDAYITFGAEEGIVLPTVETNNADIDGTSATLNGEITDTGYPDGDPDDERGFVWDTATHADPGNTAPGASAYSDNWTESGSFVAEDFDHEATGLTELTTYYYRACAHSPAGWAYGDEITFFALLDGVTYLEFRPDLNETRIRGNAGIPTDATVGIHTGYSLPIWAANNEELYFVHCVPDRWDNESDILIHIDSALANANESGNSYKLQVEWIQATPNEDEVPIAGWTTLTITRAIYSNDQYDLCQDWFVLDYDIAPADIVEADDLIALRVRRISATPADELDGELIILAVDFLYVNGYIDELIEEGILIGGEGVFLLTLGLLAVGLTAAMFGTKAMMLGFPSALMWAILGGYAYTQSEATWDINYLLFFASMGIMIVCLFAMYALRTKKEEEAVGDQLIDEDKEFLDEDEPKGELGESEEEGTSRRAKAVRNRAKNRRTKGIRHKVRYDDLD